jgi:hypothetical protein
MQHSFISLSLACVLLQIISSTKSRKPYFADHHIHFYERYVWDRSGIAPSPALTGLSASGRLPRLKPGLSFLGPSGRNINHCLGPSGRNIDHCLGPSGAILTAALALWVAILTNQNKETGYDSDHSIAMT